MALRLRRDVQKASYYVWFLGAEEARGLRGPRVINPVVPYLIDRAREQEPLKVTLQVSHKGIKILQGSAKHFIPHSAITSSVQIDDIVACVLLLYNPATKCPLHVHAYRCDSEVTATALNQLLQVLINRPENQKRFAELESRLGIVAPSHPPPTNNHPEQKQRISRRHEETSPKRFESSLGSDTGTSTRESECSEELLSSSVSPIPKPKGNLFDSLAAELRAKLNGNGPPILLPPRDYDTVHRSKGNLAAIELRRCQNRLIVGSTNPQTTKQVVSSRGSSGIGSDLAPSPERQDVHSSSDEENWSNEHEPSPPRRPFEPDRHHRIEIESPPKFHAQVQRTNHKYIAHEEPAPPAGYQRSIGRDKESSNRQSSWTREDEIRPIIMRPSDFDARFKKVLLEKEPPVDRNPEVDNYRHHNSNSNKEYINPPPAQERKYRKHYDDKKPNISPKYSPEASKYNKMEKQFSNKLSLEQQRQRYDGYDEEYDSEQEALYRKQNLTDKQKYQEAYMRKEITDIKQSAKYSRSPNYREPPHDDSPKGGRQRYYQSPTRDSPQIGDREYYSREYNNRNPYKEPDSLPYRESIEKMIKSPVMRYKSFENERETAHQHASGRKNVEPTGSYPRQDNRYMVHSERYEVDRHQGPVSSKRTTRSSSPDSSLLKASPKDRFQDAKDRFREMERPKYHRADPRAVPHPDYPDNRRRPSLEPVEPDGRDNWSDEERSGGGSGLGGRRRDRSRGGGPIPIRERMRNEKFHEIPTGHVPLTNSKSLSNLAKGYRHSYAEARPALPRSGGRVGLAAVNPF